MKYWLLTTEFPPFYGGGIATYCANTVEMLSAEGYSVTVITPADQTGVPYKKQLFNNYTVVQFDPHHPEFSAYMGYHAALSYRFAETVEHLIKEEGPPDMIESQDYQGIAYYLVQFKYLKQGLLNDIPIVITLHSPAFLYLDVNRVPLYKFPDYQVCEMEKQTLVAADRVISPTQFIANVIANEIPALFEKIKVVANPFRAPQAEPFDYKKNKIVFYGKLSLQKGVMSLLEYFKEIWETSYLQLVLVGGTDIVYYPQMMTMGAYVKTLYKKYIADGRLVIKDQIPPDQLKNEMSDAHVVVIPSAIDNLPYALLENMALGKVVLASVQGGQAEVIKDGENGFLFDHNIKGDFAKKLFSILSLNKEQLQKVSENAVASVTSCFSFRHIFFKKQEVLLQLKNSYKTRSVFPFLYQLNSGQQTVEHGGSLLSVVIPYYNMGNYLMEAVESVQNSKFPNKEIIIVNDGTDEQKSIEILSIAEKNHGCKIIHTSNQGLAEARNTGAKNSNGKFLAFLDPDDKVTSDYYSKAIWVLEKYSNVYGVGSFVKYFERKTSYWITSSPQPPYILAHNSVNSSALVYKRNAFLAGGLNDKQVDYGLEDYESVINMIHHGYNMVILPEVLFHYRVRKNSMFRNVNRNKLLYSYKYIIEKHREYFRDYFVELVNLLNANGPGFLYDSSGFERRVFSVQSVKSIVDKKIPKNSAAYRFAKKLFLGLTKRK